MSNVFVTLGEKCRFMGGGTPSRKTPEFFQGNIPWISVKDFKASVLQDSEEHISELAISSSATHLIPAGTVLLVTRVGLGKVAIAGCDLTINQDVKAVFPSEDVLPDFLFWFLRSQAENIVRMGAGATVKGVTLEQVKAIKMPLLSKAKQSSIIDILSRAEGIVRLQQQALDRAKALIPALFVELFGDPIDDVERVPLNDLAQVVSGVTKGRKFGGRETVFAPYLRVANVQDGHLNLSEIKEVEVLPSDITALTLISGDVLLTEGGDFDKLGRGAIWQGQINGCIHQNHVFRVRLNKDVCLPEFFAQFLQTTEARNYFLRCAKRTTNLASINMTQLRAMPVPAVSVTLQKDFVTRLADAQSIITQQTAALAKSRELFDALLAQTFSTPSIE